MQQNRNKCAGFACNCTHGLLMPSVRLDIPVISTELHFLKLWNACDRPEHKMAGVLAKPIVRS
jgi:hypothetical protein